LINPSLFVTNEEKASFLEGTMAFSSEIVTSNKLFKEWGEYPTNIQEKIKFFMAYYNAGLWTFDEKLKFSQELFYSCAFPIEEYKLTFGVSFEFRKEKDSNIRWKINLTRLKIKFLFFNGS
jgi:hypothetical protein